MYITQLIMMKSWRAAFTVSPVLGNSAQSSSVTQVSSKWRPGMSQLTPNWALAVSDTVRPK